MQFNMFFKSSLDETLSDLQTKIRADPGDAKLRIFLFQLLCVLGQWNRALEQLQICAQLDSSSATMAQTYREVIRCEIYREKVFSGHYRPQFLGQPDEWIGTLLASLDQVTLGHYDQADQLREQAFESAPEIAGTIDDVDFEWLADMDSRIGPLCEVILNGLYYWVPFSKIHAIRMEPPKDLRDIVWMPIALTLINDSEVLGFIPARYAKSYTAPEDAIKLSRSTVWQELSETTCLGKGQKMWVTDRDEYALLNIRKVIFQT